MMLAYQPVRSLATINMAVNQGLTAARRILPIIDNENEIKDKKNAEDILIKNANINFKDVVFKYTEDANEENVLKGVSLEIKGKMFK